MNNWLFGLFLLSIITSCKNSDKETDQEAPLPISTKDPGVSQNFNDPYFFKTLEGTIAGKPVVMNMIKYNDRVDANYYYEDKGETIFLIKNWNNEADDSLYFIELPNPISETSPTLTMAITEDGVKGTWTAADGVTNHPIALKETTTPPSLHFNAFNYIDSAKYLKFKTDTPTLKSTITIVTAIGEDKNADWINNQLKNIIGGDDKKLAKFSLTQTATAIVKGLVNGYQSEVDNSIVGVSSKSPHYFLNREYETLANIIYNKNGYTVISLFSYSYTGGAHGNHGTAMYCFDVSNNKQLTLKDIVTADSTTMQNLLEKNYRREYNLQPTTPLDDRLFVKHISPNNNFYFSPAGLGFIYTPYEIASYADGEINVWIPFSELKNHLNPEFAKRMNLIQ